MKYVNQRKYPHWLYITRTDLDDAEREKGRTTTVFTSACGPCAAVMVADRLLPNCGFDLSDALDLAYEVNANHIKGTNYERFAPVFAEKLGLRMESSRSVEDVCRCVRTGGAAVALVHGGRDGKVGLFTRSAHFITIINEETDGRLAILDPSLYDGKYEEEGRKGRVELTHSVILLTDATTLAEEASKTDIPFYLFWRG